MRTPEQKRDDVSKTVFIVACLFIAITVLQTYRIYRYEGRMRTYAPCQDVRVTLTDVVQQSGVEWTVSCSEGVVDVPIGERVLRIELKKAKHELVKW